MKPYAKSRIDKKKTKCKYLNLIIIDNQKVKKTGIALGCNFLGGI
jgi:hypothetical protein